MQLSKLLLVSILLIIVVYLPSNSTIYYVSPEGNNNNNGRTPQTAWRNVSYATQQVGNDPTDPDTVLVFPSVYDPAAGETFPVVVRSYTALAGLDSGVVLDANRTSQAVVAVVDETAFWLENLEITEGVVGIFVRRCSHFGIHDNIVHHNRGRGVKTRGSKHFTIRDNWIKSNNGGGLEIDHGKLVQITDNTLQLNRVVDKGNGGRTISGGGISIVRSKAVRIEGNAVKWNELYAPTYMTGDTGLGGGIFIINSGNITLLNNAIAHNSIDLDVTWGGSSCDGYGGGVYISTCQAVELRGNLIANNLLAIGGEYADAEGGGICVSASTITIRHNAIQDNTIGGADWLHLVGGAGISISPAIEVIVQENIIAGNNCAVSGSHGGGILVTGPYHQGFSIGGLPGAGNDIYGNHASRGRGLACFECRDTVTATFNYFEDPPDPSCIYPLENWDTRFWRDNSIRENEPPHILSFSPTCAETTLYVGDSLLFWIESLDYDGDSTFTWWLLNGQQVAVGDTFLFIAEPQHVGYDTVQVNVTDGRAITSHEWYLEVIGERSALLAKLSSLPKTFALQGNYPNPFNLSTMIKYQLPVDCYVRLEVYDLLGRKVATLAEGEQEAGYRSFTWDASKVSSGIYIYKLTAGDFSRVKKMMLVK